MIRVIVILDSRVAVGAVRKGRSSSRKLNALLRQIAALQLDSGVRLEVAWVPTWGNPADAPTRFASLEDWLQEKGKKAPAQWPEQTEAFKRWSAGDQGDVPGPPRFYQDPLQDLRTRGLIGPWDSEAAAAKIPEVEHSPELRELLSPFPPGVGEPSPGPRRKRKVAPSFWYFGLGVGTPGQLLATTAARRGWVVRRPFRRSEGARGQLVDPDVLQGVEEILTEHPLTWVHVDLAGCGRTGDDDRWLRAGIRAATTAAKAGSAVTCEVPRNLLWHPALAAFLAGSWGFDLVVVADEDWGGEHGARAVLSNVRWVRAVKKRGVVPTTRSASRRVWPRWLRRALCEAGYSVYRPRLGREEEEHDGQAPSQPVRRRGAGALRAWLH